MIGYALDAELARTTFWTFSVWDDQASLDAFAASDPHRAITRPLQPLMEQTRFEFFQIPRFGLAHDLGPDESTSTRPAQPRQHPVGDGRGRRNGRSMASGSGAAGAACRPLAAANADLPWPGQPHLVLWHAITVLREQRGDGHIAALQVAGLDPCEALVSFSAIGAAPEDVFASRGRSAAEWSAARDRLTAREWITCQ